MGVNRARTNVGYGLSNALQNLAPLPIVSNRAPATNDIAEIGTMWIDVPNNDAYVLTSISGGSATWSITQAAGAVVTSLTVTGGDNDVTVDAGGTVTISSATINFDAAAGTTTITNDLDIGGALTVTGLSTFDGDIVINGDFDINSAEAISFTATGDQDPAILLHTNGGTSETLQLINTQGTAVDAIEISSVQGGVEVNSASLMAFVSSRNNAQAILLNASAGGIDVTAAGAAGEDIDIVNTAGSININSGEVIADSMVLTSAGGLDFAVAGTGGLDIDMVNSAGAVNISSGQAAADAIVLNASDAAGGVQIQAGSNGILIGNQADCAVIDLGDIAPTASRLVTVAGGTVVTAAVTDQVDIAPDGATTNADSQKIVTINAGNVTTGVLTASIASGTAASGTHTVNISTGTGGGTKVVNVGNADGLTTVNIDGIALINDSVNVNTSINTGTSTGAVAIGNAAAGAITVDSAAGISLDAATASNFTVANNALTIASGTGQMDISADAAATTVNVATGGAVKGLTLGSTNSTSASTLQAGTGAMTFTAGGIFDVNATGAVTVDTLASISLDSATASNFTVTGSADLTLASTAGSVIASSGEAVIDAIQLTASNAAGGVTVTTGTLAATTGLHLTQGAATAAVQVGAGAPAHAAPQGTLYLNTTGSSTSTRAYINTDGSTTWTNLVTAA